MQQIGQVEASTGERSAYHWAEYRIEAAALAAFMLSACMFAVLLEHPRSPVRQEIESGLLRRALMGVAMGLTAVAVITSPWGRRSGAHMNPAVTLTFWTLGKVAAKDAALYVVFQFVGGLVGVVVARSIIGPALEDSAINFVATVPGPSGPWVAFVAEIAISAIVMLTVLFTSSSTRLARFTPYFVGTLVASYITFEAPLSGMSMNPARTLGSAVAADDFRALWVYFTAPVLGMFLASTLFRVRARFRDPFCAKLHPCDGRSCIFHCR